jgi:hypothetical protein
MNNLNELVEMQRERLRNVRQSRTFRYLDLLISLIQPSSRFPTEEDLKRGFGDKLAATLDTLCNSASTLSAEYDVADILQRNINSDEELQKLKLDRGFGNSYFYRK